MFKDWSFSPRVLVIIILVVVLPLVYLAASYLGQGYVTITVDKPDGWIVINNETHLSPYTARLRSGRETVYYGATGFSESRARITILPLRLSKKYVFTPTDPLKYEHSEEEDVLDDFENKNPWAKSLPHFVTGKYEIEYPQPDGTIYVTFLLKPGDYPSGASDQAYKKDLLGLKKEVLEWLKSKGATEPENLKFNWVPIDPEAAR